MGDKCCSECGAQISEAVMLKRVDGIIREYRTKPGALIPVLQIAQKMFGHLPVPVMKRISLGLDKPYSEVAGVVSFYSFFSTVPRGKYLVRVCLGTACYVRGGKEVLAAITKQLGIDVGQTTKDGQFSLEVGRCFGACGLAPVIMVNDTVHKRVRPARVAEILASYMKKGARAKGVSHAA